MRLQWIGMLHVYECEESNFDTMIYKAWDMWIICERIVMSEIVLNHYTYILT